MKRITIVQMNDLHEYRGAPGVLLGVRPGLSIERQEALFVSRQNWICYASARDIFARVT